MDNNENLFNLEAVVDEPNQKRKKLYRKYSLPDSMKIISTTCLDQNCFQWPNIRIVGQANNQIIICLLKKEQLLLAFDQHAVHERIRYEQIKLNAINPNNNQLLTKLVRPPNEIPIPIDLGEKIDQHLDNFEQFLSIKLSIKNKSTIVISQVPICFQNYYHPGVLQDFLIDALNCFNNSDRSNS